MKKMVGIFALLIVTTTLFSSLASAAPNFTATDPQDVTDPDFDIVEGGAYPSGDYIVFWMKVRGQINLNPTDNYYEHVYTIDIYFHNNEIDLSVAAYNYDGKIEKVASMTVNNGGLSTLTEGKDYVISDNKLSFYIDKNIGNIGSIENTDITDVNFEAGKVGGNSDVATDSLYWEPGSSSGGGGGSSSNSGGLPPWIWWAVIGIILIVVIIVVVVIVVFKKPQQPPYQPPPQYPPPQQPPPPPTQ